jgi:hypothetical protein
MKKTILSVSVPLALILAIFIVLSPGAQAQASTCPVGYICTPVSTAVPACPTGYVCKPIGQTQTTYTGNEHSYGNDNWVYPTTSVNSSCYVFSTDLSLGSTGAGVVALQNRLIEQGYSIPAVSSGRVAKGYYGSQTAYALGQYQDSVGITAEDGNLGPITRAKLNGSCTDTTTASPQPIQAPEPPSITMSWSGGNQKVNLGLIDNRFETNGTILGWIILNRSSSGSLTWGGTSITDLAGTVAWNPTSLSQGPFRIIAVTPGPTGNLCTTSSADGCRYVISSRFNFASTFNLTLPPFEPVTAAYPLSAWCTSTSKDVGSDILWSAAVSGGKAPYTYAWSVYNDVIAYPTGGTQSASFVATYSSGGTKQAVVRVTDSAGNVTSATCMGSIVSPSTSTQSPITVLSPNGGEYLTSGQTSKITWSGGSGNVDIYLLDYSSRLGRKIFSNIPNTHSVDWLVAPLTSNDLYNAKTGSYETPSGGDVIYVGCSSVSSCAVSDTSDSYFKISAATTASSCTDSDGGININVAGLTDGRVNGLGSYFQDVSVDSNGGQCSGTSCTSVAEGYCSNGTVTNYLYSCPSGYSVGGACATKP